MLYYPQEVFKKFINSKCTWYWQPNYAGGAALYSESSVGIQMMVHDFWELLSTGRGNDCIFNVIWLVLSQAADVRLSWRLVG